MMPLATPSEPARAAPVAPTTRVWVALMLAVSAGLVATLWSVGYLPTNDGPEHVLSGYIENHYEDAGNPYRDVLTLLPAFASRGFALLFVPFEALFGWATALKLSQSVMALAMLWGFALLVLALERSREDASPGLRRFAAPLGVVVALPWSFYMGFFPNTVATGFGLFVLAFALWHPSLSGRRRFVVAMLLLLEAVMHVFSAGITGGVLLVLGLASSRRGRRLREAGLSAAMGAPAAGIAALTLLDRKSLASVVASQEAGWETWGERLRGLAGSAVPGATPRGYLCIALVLIGCAITVARARRGRASRVEAALAGLTLTFLALTLLLPLNIPGWQNVSLRFAGLAVLLGLALVNPADLIEKRRWPPMAAPAGILALASASLLVTYRFHRALSDGCADLTSGLGRGPSSRGGHLLPIIAETRCVGLDRADLDATMPRLEPALHVGALYAADRAQLEPYVFMGAPSVHALGARPGAKLPFSPDTEVWLQLSRMQAGTALRTEAMAHFALWGMPWDTVLMYGATAEDVRMFSERGYATEWQRGALLITHFESCASALSLPGGDVEAPVLVELGVPFVVEPIDKVVLRPSKEPREIPLLRGICGPVWVHVAWDLDRSGTVTPGDSFCGEADATGRFEATVTRSAPRVTCRSAWATP